MKRAYSSSVTDSSGNIYIIAGGTNVTYYTDIWRYTPASNSWTQLANPPSTFKARGFHTSVLDPRTNLIYMIGGSGVAQGEIALSDVWTYSIAQGKTFFLNTYEYKYYIICEINVTDYQLYTSDSWQIFNTTGAFSKRNSHTTVIDPNTGISYTTAGKNSTKNLCDVVALEFPSKYPQHTF